MSDYFFDDMDGMDDSFGDPDDDFQDDQFDEYDEGLNALADDADPDSVLPQEENTSDNAKAVIMGGMIAGQAYSEGKHLRGQEKLRWLMQQQDKRKK